jgi:formylglycine-generating enzyme required for sulfatase activity
LLEFVLRQLWEQRRGGELHHEAYRAMGQLEGAIAAKADSIFSRLSPQDQRRVQQIFLRLVRPGEGEADTRRRATSTELGQEAQGLVKTLADERLVVTSRLAGSVEDTVEVSHEALVRHWSHLKGWVDADRQFLVWQQRLNVMRKEWGVGQRSADLLLHGLSLREATEWLKKKPESFSPDERVYITASQNRRTRVFAVAAIGAAFLLWLIGGTTWLWQKGYTVDQAALKIESLVHSIHVPPQMEQIPGGTFQMGDVEKLGESWQNPVHPVMIKPFSMGKYEVTFEEYDAFAIATGRRLSEDQGWGRERRPVINVTWDDAKAYAAWLSAETGKRYRLPSESEWEYAARSGAKQEAWAGTSKESDLDHYAVSLQNSGNHTAEVGTKQANAFGLHDLSGNVGEWVEDCAHGTYERAPSDGSGWLEADEGDCNLRVIRGGSWLYAPVFLRVSSRNGSNADFRTSGIGFRLAQDSEF